MKTQNSGTKVLVVRNDKLGDFMLIYPALALLKNSSQNIHITVLVPRYTADMAKICPWIDEIIIDPGSKGTFSEQLFLHKELCQQNFSAIITLFSTTRIGFLAFIARIKYRLAPATKIAQIFYNNRLTQRRSRSLQPEYEYNIDVVKRFLDDFNIKHNHIAKPPYLSFNENEINSLRHDFYKKHNINENNKLIFIHPGSGGSANNLSLDQYANLIHQLMISDNYFFVITAGPGEFEYADSLSDKISDIPHTVFRSTKGLVNFSKHIQLCSLFISGSTGPLHIAGALDRPTAAFYQRLRSATPLRWQTLNTKENRLAFTPPDDSSETDMHKIDTLEAAQKIKSYYNML